MIDIHSHILPYIDDGSNDLEQTLSMLKDCIDQGINDIILTPHYEKLPRRLKKGVNINEEFNKLTDYIKSNNLNINVYLGNEITIDENIIDDIKNKRCLTLNNSKYILLELDFYEIYKDLGELIYELSLLGYQVIIAHVERYMYSNVEFIKMLINEGALIQVNADSFFSKENEIRKFVLKLLKNDYIHFISSDLHYVRENKMLEAYNLVSKKCNKETANLLFKENPRKVLLNEDI